MYLKIGDNDELDLEINGIGLHLYRCLFNGDCYAVYMQIGSTASKVYIHNNSKQILHKNTSSTANCIVLFPVEFQQNG